jgi:hypothetical protein
MGHFRIWHHVQLECKKLIPARARKLMSLRRFAGIILLAGSSVFGFALGARAAPSPIQRTANISGALNTDFAVADFDGDRRPDFVSVELGSFNSSIVRYAVTLHLTSGGGQSIGVTAPFGGLSIEARDINGDAALDLVIRSNWFRQPVAILINDGRGQFTLANPAAYPAVMEGCPAEWTSGTEPAGERVALTLQKTYVGEFEEGEKYFSPQHNPDSPLMAVQLMPGSPFQSIHSGRAPPAFTSHV